MGWWCKFLWDLFFVVANVRLQLVHFTIYSKSVTEWRATILLKNVLFLSCWFSVSCKFPNFQDPIVHIFFGFVCPKPSLCIARFGFLPPLGSDRSFGSTMRYGKGRLRIPQIRINITVCGAQLTYRVFFPELKLSRTPAVQQADEMTLQLGSFCQTRQNDTTGWSLQERRYIPISVQKVALQNGF